MERPTYEGLKALVANGFAKRLKDDHYGHRIYAIGSQIFNVRKRRKGWCEYVHEVLTPAEMEAEFEAFLDELRQCGYKKVWVNVDCEEHWHGRAGVGYIFAEPPQYGDGGSTYPALWYLKTLPSDGCGNARKGADQMQNGCCHHFPPGIYDLTK